MQTKNNIVTVIFSKDRPLQLDLTLTTYEKYTLYRNIENEFVIYKASNDRFEKAYIRVAEEHPDIKFIKETTFKINLYDCLKGNKYILFVVDDCIFTKKYSIKNICTKLDICEGALGFSLRLGKNTKYCYSLGIDNTIPIMQSIGDNVVGFPWKSNVSDDFSYPLEVSSSIYRIQDIKPIIEGVHYSNPNQLEWIMYNYIPQLVHRQFLLSFDESVAFCNPINRVQTENNNRAGVKSEYTIENLLVLYEGGYRIADILFDGFISESCHQEVDIDFISPSDDNKLGIKHGYK